MFKKVLIANRGEIALRIQRACRELGIKSVVVYSEADRDAKYVRLADEAVCIGPAPSAQSYLSMPAIIATAEVTDAEAIHPGYGFLSENEAFAQACADAGVVFIGPPPRAIQAMGLKAESKRLMEAAGVPLVPGYHGADQDPALLKREADRIGYPVLIKASAGGGGKGMRAVFSADEFDAALASCKREAINSFGDDAVLIERYVQRPRHIEIQVLGDSQGNVVYLHERECSIQRRHQKVIEEAPSPFISEATRKAMGEQAVALAKAVKYQSAGTVEFVVGKDQDFYFLEMNTRLQVEHPVTELVTGIDIVQQQIKIAAGEKLPFTQRQIELKGHAIECRINAEDPVKFTPSPGRITMWHAPGGPGVRVDSHAYTNYFVPPNYDSMIGKIIVHGDTRDQALARMRIALSETVVEGIQTNIPLHRELMADAKFIEGGTSIHYLEAWMAAHKR
mmetsp:Transcript_5900/g.14497  ORF Transcript_5900/g.14497 Transcript_5900/m.14497 type:complete len:450 (+) Transcript_5900:668-2017(+)